MGKQMADLNPYQSPLVGPDDAPVNDDAPDNEVLPFEGMIRLKLGHSQQTYAVGVALATSQTWNRWFTMIGENWFRAAVVVFFVGVAYGITLGDGTLATICAVMGAVGAGLWLWKLNEARRAWQRYHQYIVERYHNVDQYFDEAGLHINGEDMTNFFGWSRFDGYRADPTVAVVYQDFPDHYQIYSRDSLEVPEHWPEFMGILKRHLQQR